MFQESVKKRKPLEIVGIVVVFILAVAIISTFILYGIFRDSNSAPSLFGKRVYIMSGSGMEPRIPQGAAVFIEEGTLPTSEGNVILCNIDGKLALVGYVGTQTAEEDGELVNRYIVQYDSSSADQQWTVDAEDIIGKASSYDSFLGGLITFASSKAGMLAIVIIPCALLVIYEIVMLVISLRKKKAVRAEYDSDPFYGGYNVFDTNSDGGADERIMNQSGSTEIDFGFDTDNSETKEESEQSVPLFDFSDFTPKYSVSKEQAEAEPAVSFESEPVLAFTSEPEPIVSEPKHENYEPSVSIAETTAKLDEVAKVLASEEPSPAASSRIDELIKLLEEEKARLAGKQ